MRFTLQLNQDKNPNRNWDSPMTVAAQVQARSKVLIVQPSARGTVMHM